MVPLIGGARLDTYKQAHPTSDDTRLGQIYAWQASVGGAWHEVLGYTEVLLRNAIDTALTSWNAAQPTSPTGAAYGTDWLLNPAPPLSIEIAQARTDAQVAARKARTRRAKSHPRKTAPITHDDLLAQLTFGNLTYLLPNPDQSSGARTRRSNSGFTRKENLWLHAIHTGFPNLNNVYKLDPSLPEDAAIVDQGIRVAESMTRLNHLRNRVAHHEQTLTVAHRDRHKDATRLVASVSPQAASAIGELSRVMALVSPGP